jgi:NAD(P)H dehydrogenase (quinone)
MFAITGITGNVGGEVARNLLAAKQPVRAVVRDLGKGAAWAERGCDLARADIGDASALAAAFQGVEGVFVLVPPNFDPTPGFPEAQAIADSLFSALEHARPGRVVYLSTIGAQATQPTSLPSTQSLSGCSASRRFPLLSCGRDGSWRIPVGT